MKGSELLPAAEAILFAAAEPIELSRIAAALELSSDDAEELLINLSEKLDERKSGVALLKLGMKYQLCSRKEYAEVVRTVLDLKRNAPLSHAAFEVLAVIAYNQPVTKAFIEQVRGVDCSGVITTLALRGLIEEKGRLDLPGRPLIYGTTADFLRCFSITSLSELPELPEDDRDILMTGMDDGGQQLTFENGTADDGNQTEQDEPDEPYDADFLQETHAPHDIPETSDTPDD